MTSGRRVLVAAMLATLIAVGALAAYLRHARTVKIKALNDTAAAGFKTGDYKSAEGALDALIALKPAGQLADLLAQRSYARALSGALQPALADADEALKLQSNIPLAYAARCVAYEGAKDWDKALAQCSDAQGKIPPHQDGLAVVLRSRLASAKFSLGDYLGAQAEYSSVLAMSPAMAAAYLNRAMVAVMIGPREQGQADLKKAMELDPTLKPERLGAAALLLNEAFEPLISVSLRRGREALTALAALELMRYQSSKDWALSVDELLKDRPEADAVRAQLAAAFDGGTVLFTTSDSALTMSGRAKGSKREVSAQGDSKGFVLPALKWENGAFEELKIAPPKPASRAKKRPGRKK